VEKNRKNTELIRIHNGRLIDPGHFDGIADIVIDNGKIVEIIDVSKKGSESPQSGIQHPATGIIHAGGKWVTPGLIDLHVHLREPGYEYKETIQSGCMAAVAGGFTAVCAMPNTNPVNDNREVTEYIINKAGQSGTARVFPVGAISKGLGGKQLCDYGELKDAGAVAVSDDGRPVMDSRLMRRALEAARGFDLLVISHSEDLKLAAGGVMNEGALATRLGLAGIPNACECIMVMREIALAELTAIPVHIAHVSTKESVRAIRDAKGRGVPVTAETAPHYFTLTEDAVEKYNTNAKMNPPLRSRDDRAAIREGLADGTIDVIATDHAPHSDAEKDVAFEKAANGIIGLETSLSLTLKLVEDGVISLPQLVDKMAKRPAKLLGFDNSLTTGKAADITIIDPERDYVVESAEFRSLSRNTPFEGWKLKGKAVLTMVAGRVVFNELASSG
jgi:dihydroorotase